MSISNRHAAAAFFLLRQRSVNRNPSEICTQFLMKLIKRNRMANQLKHRVCRKKGCISDAHKSLFETVGLHSLFLQGWAVLTYLKLYPYKRRIVSNVTQKAHVLVVLLSPN